VKHPRAALSPINPSQNNQTCKTAATDPQVAASRHDPVNFHCIEARRLVVHPGQAPGGRGTGCRDRVRGWRSGVVPEQNGGAEFAYALLAACWAAEVTTERVYLTLPRFIRESCLSLCWRSVANGCGSAGSPLGDADYALPASA
jgi:hypothetical protein